MFVQDPMTYLGMKVHCKLYLPLENNSHQLRMVYKLPLMSLMSLKFLLYQMYLKYHLYHLSH